jgi:hypothetical protein
MSPNAGGGGGRRVSAEYSCAHGAQINFGDLTPYTEEKRRNEEKATRRHKRTRDDEGMGERLVLKEVYKIKQASENGGESLQWKKHVEACLEAHSGVNTGVSEMVRVTQ